MYPTNVGVIGTGSMGGMLVRALARYGAVKPEQIWAANRSSPRLEVLAAEVPGIHRASPAAVVEACPLVFLCVKPGDTAVVLDEVGPLFTPGHLLVVISNMLDLAEVEQRVAARVAKVIPSLAQEVGAGVVLIMHGSRLEPGDCTRLRDLLAHIGRPVVIPEHMGRTCSDLSSCGPAFLAYVLREMAHSAARAEPELSPELAEGLVRETAMATARLLVEGGLSFDSIISRIAVPGGITAEGLQALTRHLPAAWDHMFSTTREMEELKKSGVRI